MSAVTKWACLRLLAATQPHRLILVSCELQRSKVSGLVAAVTERLQGGEAHRRLAWLSDQSSMHELSPMQTFSTQHTKDINYLFLKSKYACIYIKCMCMFI